MQRTFIDNGEMNVVAGNGAGDLGRYGTNIGAGANERHATTADYISNGPGVIECR